jgi:hypothetical protein
METIDVINDFLSETDEQNKCYALIDFLCSLSISNLNKVLFPTNVIKFEKSANGRAQQYSICAESDIDYKKDSVLYLIGVEIVSRSKPNDIPLPAEIVYSLMKCGIDWLKYSMVGASSLSYSGYSDSWNNFIDCVLPVYVVSKDGKSHPFKTASGNTRIMMQGWVRHGDIVKEVVRKDNKRSASIERCLTNYGFFRSHSEINFQIVCRSLLSNIIESQDQCFKRLCWGQSFSMEDIQDCITEGNKFLATNEKSIKHRLISNKKNLCITCGKLIPFLRRLRNALYCSETHRRQATNIRHEQKSAHQN